MSGIDWGDVPTWCGAIFAASAAGAAVWTLASQRAQIREQRHFIGEQAQNLALEREELRAAAAARREAQAKQVYMHARMSGSEWDDDGEVVPDQWIVSVMNRSDAPLHGLELRFGSAYLASDVQEIPPTALHSSNPGERRSLPVDLLGPGRALRFQSQQWSRTVVHNNKPTLSFTDEAGVRWTLDWQGKLEEAPPGPQA
ncbi:hypothetical protein [Streptomyces sp. EKS3.2]|uniref:hypothetical protein n=1 Tax=Streptomyces sp. EKS3.2 TaxID=3461008 RepID=UPI00404260FF